MPAGAAVPVALAGLIRRLHDAADGWEPSADAAWGSIPGQHHVAVPALFDRPELIAHQDYCPGNVVFRTGRARHPHIQRLAAGYVLWRLAQEPVQVLATEPPFPARAHHRHSALVSPTPQRHQVHPQHLRLESQQCHVARYYISLMSA